MGKFKDKKKKSMQKKKLGRRKKLSVKERILERDEHMKGGPPNCVICLVPIQTQPAPSTSSTLPVDTMTESSLNQVQSIHLCEMLDIPLSFKQGFQEYSFCNSCYQKIERASILLVLVPEIPTQSEAKARRKEMKELESIIKDLKAKLCKFQIQIVTLNKERGDSDRSQELLQFRTNVCKEMQSKLNYVTEKREPVLRLESIYNLNPKDTILENSGPPNCIICMRGPGENLEIHPLLQEECLQLIRLLRLSDKLKEDFNGSQAYSCSQCLVKIKSVNEMYKQIERINIGLADSREFFEKGILELPTPNAKSASQIDPELVGFVILRRRMAKELHICKTRRFSAYEISGTSGVNHDADVDNIDDEEGSPLNDDIQDFCEVILTENPDSGAGASQNHNSNLQQGKRVYKDIKCEYCDMTYRSHKSLKIHRNRIHFDILPFKCKYCDQGFVTKEKLEKHENSHEGIRNNECRICHKLFSRRSAMKVHEAKHTGVRSFQCELCDKNYLAYAALRKHIEAIHGTEKFICELCGKELPSRHYLNSHVRKHQEKEAGIVRPKSKVPIGRGCTPVILNFDVHSFLSSAVQNVQGLQNETVSTESLDQTQDQDQDQDLDEPAQEQQPQQQQQQQHIHQLHQQQQHQQQQQQQQHDPMQMCNE
ncbi:unnamed protein product [Allacma fusca]|uniref:C2H2-type domain-containing protein n=1 Tax=Allacma fusca TaxID=39272 RepID=A0A8J2P090_9HEXA|nr:unnamed protein product [Allacma fusca]